MTGTFGGLVSKQSITCVKINVGKKRKQCSKEKKRKARINVLQEAEGGRTAR